MRAEWTPEVLAYWQHFGDTIGAPVKAIPIPAALQRDVVARAVAVRAGYAEHMDAVDLDIVARTLVSCLR